MTLCGCLHWLGCGVWRSARVLWVCRVPFVSVFGGGALLAATPQARDFFADLGIDWWQWGILFGLVFLWAWIAHAAARRALQYDDWVPEAHAAGGLTAERRSELQAEFYWPALIIPRAIGVSAFLFIGWAICRTRRNVMDAIALPEASRAAELSLWLLISAIVVTAAYAAVVLSWRRRNQDVPVAAILLTGAAPIFASKAAMKELIPATKADWLLDIGRVVILGFLGWTIIDPHAVGDLLPRLFFAPILFAGIVLVLGEFAAWSHRLRTPLLLVLAAVGGVLLYYVDQFHDVYWVSARQPVVQTRQLDMPTAVARWRQVNKCEEGSGKECPRPILIAGAGGASRAAFLTATVVGALMDLDQNPENVARYGEIRNRIFAMSTVSGSSVGAAVIRAAMTDAAVDGKPSVPPCVSEGKGSWFGQLKLASGVTFDVKKSWRDCFQVILAGDFLSAVIAGLAYRDNFPMSNPLTGAPLWADRGRLLEQGFEHRYWRMTSKGKCEDGAGNGDRNGLCRPFGYHPDPATAGAWIPLLFINGTSVSTGRRIVIADVPIGQRYIVPATSGSRRPKRNFCRLHMIFGSCAITSRAATRQISQSAARNSMMSGSRPRPESARDSRSFPRTALFAFAM